MCKFPTETLFIKEKEARNEQNRSAILFESLDIPTAEKTENVNQKWCKQPLKISLVSLKRAFFLDYIIFTVDLSIEYANLFWFLDDHLSFIRVFYDCEINLFTKLQKVAWISGSKVVTRRVSLHLSVPLTLPSTCEHAAANQPLLLRAWPSKHLQDSEILIPRLSLFFIYQRARSCVDFIQLESLAKCRKARRLFFFFSLAISHNCRQCRLTIIVA